MEEFQKRKPSKTELQIILSKLDRESQVGNFVIVYIY